MPIQAPWHWREMFQTPKHTVISYTSIALEFCKLKALPTQKNVNSCLIGFLFLIEWLWREQPKFARRLHSTGPGQKPTVNLKRIGIFLSNFHPVIKIFFKKHPQGWHLKHLCTSNLSFFQSYWYFTDKVSLRKNQVLVFELPDIFKVKT